MAKGEFDISKVKDPKVTNLAKAVEGFEHDLANRDFMARFHGQETGDKYTEKAVENLERRAQGE